MKDKTEEEKVNAYSQFILTEAAKIYSSTVIAECYKEPLSVAIRQVAKDAFIAGVNWCNERVSYAATIQ